MKLPMATTSDGETSLDFTLRKVGVTLFVVPPDSECNNKDTAFSKTSSKANMCDKFVLQGATTDHRLSWARLVFRPLCIASKNFVPLTKEKVNLKHPSKNTHQYAVSRCSAMRGWSRGTN